MHSPERATPRDLDRNREDPSDFSQLWATHYPKLLRRAISWTNGNHQDAEDAVGQTALVAFQRLPEGLTSQDAYRWLLRVLYNKCMDAYRRRARLPHQPIDTLEMSTLAQAHAEPSFETASLTSELLRFVLGCIRQLPPNLRTAAELRLLQETPYPEAAHRLGISEANLRKRVQQARQILRQRLEDYRDDQFRTRPDETPSLRRGEKSFHSSKS